MVEVQGKGSSSNVASAGLNNAFSGERLTCNTQYPPTEPQPTNCPQCRSKRIFKDGFRESPLITQSKEPIQRYRCADYGHRFSKHLSEQSFKKELTYKRSSQISVIPQDAKNLAPTQKTKICVEKERQSPTEHEIKATQQIEKLLIQLVNDGKAQSTTRNYRIYLKLLLTNGADLFDTENTKAVLAKLTLKKASKRLCASLLNTWFDFNNIFWKKPTYYKDSEIPYIPIEEETDQLIAGVGKKTATFCQLLKDTGARSGEIAQLTWSDIDFNQRRVNIKAEKRSNGRLLPLSEKALNMLSNLPRKKQRLFANSNSVRACFYSQRKRLANKISNPNLLKIHFHTFRHYKATKELHDFHDRERVQIILGHKSANSTETYVHIDKMLYLSKGNDSFVVKVADTLEDVIKLAELGFEPYSEIAGHKVFRKRK